MGTQGKMKEIPLSQGKVALVDDEDYEWLSQWKWCASFNGCTWYAVRKDCSGPRRRMVKMHRLIMGEPMGIQVDHINGDGWNNQRKNLRLDPNSQNQHNRRKNRRGSSLFKGVSWRKGCRRWWAYIVHLGVKKHLGYFDSEEVAARAYDKAAKELFGEFARLNFPDDVRGQSHV
jgi:hypothetical protein